MQDAQKRVEHTVAAVGGRRGCSSVAPELGDVSSRELARPLLTMSQGDKF